MKCEPFDSPLWSSTSAFSGPALALVPVLQRLQVGDWSRVDSSPDWVLLTGELVDGYDVSPAAELVLPCILQFSEGRSPGQLLLPWTLIGDVEIARLAGGRVIGTMDTILEAAASLACGLQGRGSAPAQHEMAAAICVLPRLRPWARLMTLRLVVIGKRYAECLACQELIDVEWDGAWRVGDTEVERRTIPPSRRDVLDEIKREADAQGATALTAVQELAGVARCPACGVANDVIALLAHPIEVPE